MARTEDTNALRINVAGDVDAQILDEFELHVPTTQIATQHRLQVRAIVAQSIIVPVKQLRGLPMGEVGALRPIVFVRLPCGKCVQIRMHILRH
jgi:hypothetical protein